MRQYGQALTHGETADGVTSLVFRAGALLCALPLDEVIETMRPLETRPLAGTPPYVRGISVLRGLPTPVIDVARLLGGAEAEVRRYVAVRTEKGPVALATGAILGIRATTSDIGRGHPALLGGGSKGFIAGVGIIDTEPLLLLQSMRSVPDEVWEAAAAASVPT